MTTDKSDNIEDQTEGEKPLSPPGSIFSASYDATAGSKTKAVMRARKGPELDTVDDWLCRVLKR